MKPYIPILKYPHGYEPFFADIEIILRNIASAFPKSFVKTGSINGVEVVHHRLGTTDVIVQVRGASWSDLTKDTITLTGTGEYKLLMLEVR